MAFACHEKQFPGGVPGVSRGSTHGKANDMSSDSDDSVSLSGCESELDLDDIFGESDEEDNDFERFDNNEIPAEIQRQWSRTADDNREHFTEFLIRQMLALRETTQGRTQPRFLVCFWMKKFFSTLKRGPTGMPLRREVKIRGSIELHWPLWKTQASFEHFFSVLMAMNDLIKKPRYENYFERTEQF